MQLTILIGLALVGVLIWWIYNNLVSTKIRVSEAWSGIDLQLKRRADLIPNLVNTVKGYVKHEEKIFEMITKARSELLQAPGPKASDMALEQLKLTEKPILAFAEDNPELKASDNFLELQKQLADTEDKIAYARQYYNFNVSKYNTMLKVFPNIFFAKLLGFKEAEFFGNMTQKPAS